ncbi:MULTISPECIES: hypothetical protein [Brevibacillus]|jgi:hypothetical protein|uniref:Uncharacterized protein n=1 Tax=Brevibacillus borstelensis AK1 TaxID=1300222 RepID=M8D9V7_9BACL|nr:hypothetical protein [Brevibacillus borstelensis]EMT50138.1 hypothetical protein I532_23884 [Brevibacillus borstelensis AK1]MBE5394202.1 hypothetical protein [Brevibacillus borstelensis]MCC0566162.1 hypothetical protein [Brevibacillus borstelensis]MCM3472475.1 hypothetical protein [Brevibacillus borstelensis]MCM3560760.1 hypothetical protein [Brevibacillus borstelensis]
MSADRFYLIYQEASDEECLLTIQPYDDQQALAEAINRLQSLQVDEYTIIKGRKMRAALRLAVELQEDEDTQAEADGDKAAAKENG